MLACALGLLATIIIAEMVVLIRQRLALQSDEALFQQNLFEQSESLDRVLFAAAKEFASQAQTGQLETRIELARSLVSHASFYRQMDLAMVLHVLGDDPLGLSGRLSVLEEIYSDRKVLLESAFSRLAAARGMDAQKALLGEFQALSLGFLDTLMEMSLAWHQLESLSFTHIQNSHQREVAFLGVHQVTLVAVAALIALLALLGAKRLLRSVKSLSGLIPICASCKRIRTDQGYWSQVEHYIKQHSEASFTHGLCPDCFRTLYGELASPEPEEPG